MRKLLTLLPLTAITSICLSQNVAINTDGSAADPSAALDIKSGSKGLLIPRMSTASRNAIASPANGLIVFDTDLNRFFFRGSGTWIEMSSGGSTNYWSQNSTHIFNNTAGNVGIGVTDPAFKLDVGTRMRLRASAGQSAGTWLNNNANSASPAFIGMATDSTVGFYGNSFGWGLTMNTNNGKVGVGTANPSVPLHVVANGQAVRLQGTTPYIGFYNAANEYRGFLWQGPGNNMSIGITGNVGGQFEVYNNDVRNLALFNNGTMYVAGSNATIEMWDDGFRSGIIKGSGTSSLEIAASRTEVIGGTPGNLILQTNTNTAFGTAFAGNVGIGTASPIGKLQIKHPGPTAHLILESPTLNSYALMLFANTGGGRYWGIGGRTSNGPITDDRLSFYNISTGFETMVMVGDGYVSVPGKMGIGTFNPEYKFAVNGNIRSKEVVVETGWADYVFDKNYRLRPLDELEQYIKANKHLPGIPTAAEIEKNGLQLGDTQKRMMEKIEELTLYIIELKKEIEILKAK